MELEGTATRKIERYGKAGIAPSISPRKWTANSEVARQRKILKFENTRNLTVCDCEIKKNLLASGRFLGIGPGLNYGN
jgi:hypothetical protein